MGIPIGSRVVLEVDNPDDNRYLVAGDEGTIICHSDGRYDYCVEFDRMCINGTNGPGRRNHCWYVKEHEISPVSTNICVPSVDIVRLLGEDRHEKAV